MSNLFQVGTVKWEKVLFNNYQYVIKISDDKAFKIAFKDQENAEVTIEEKGESKFCFFIKGSLNNKITLEGRNNSLLATFNFKESNKITFFDEEFFIWDKKELLDKNDTPIIGFSSSDKTKEEIVVDIKVANKKMKYLIGFTLYLIKELANEKIRDSQDNSIKLVSDNSIWSLESQVKFEVFSIAIDLLAAL